MIGYYKLNENNQVVPVSDITVSQWKRVKLEEVNGYQISTVFMGLDHRWNDNGLPIVFETAIIKPDGHFFDYQERCSTWDEALKMHEEAKRALLNGEVE